MKTSGRAWAASFIAFGLSLGIGLAAGPAGAAEGAGVEPSPVIIVHGWHGVGDDRLAGSVLEPIGTALRDAGHPVYWAGGIGVDPSDTVFDAAEVLALTVETVSDAHPGERLSIVAHSFGGIVARAYLESELYERSLARGVTVGNLVALGAPHAGIDLWLPLVFALGDPLSEPSVWELTPAYMALFNSAFQPRSDIRYTLIAGDARDQSFAFWLLPSGDGVVESKSALGLSSISNSPSVRRFETADIHTWNSATRLLGWHSYMDHARTLDDVILPAISSAGDRPPITERLSASVGKKGSIEHGPRTDFESEHSDAVRRGWNEVGSGVESGPPRPVLGPVIHFDTALQGAGRQALDPAAIGALVATASGRLVDPQHGALSFALPRSGGLLGTLVGDGLAGQQRALRDGDPRRSAPTSLASILSISLSGASPNAPAAMMAILPPDSARLTLSAHVDADGILLADVRTLVPRAHGIPIDTNAHSVQSVVVERWVDGVWVALQLDSRIEYATNEHTVGSDSIRHGTLGTWRSRRPLTGGIHALRATAVVDGRAISEFETIAASGTRTSPQNWFGRIDANAESTSIELHVDSPGDYLISVRRSVGRRVTHIATSAQQFQAGRQALELSMREVHDAVSLAKPLETSSSEAIAHDSDIEGASLEIQLLHVSSGLTPLAHATIDLSSSARTAR